MITAGDFRNGVTFEMDGQVMQVVEFQHVKPGKGAAFVRTKMKNVITGAVTETSFNPTAKFENATVDRVSMEYSYQDGNLYYFMNPETYELEPVDESVLGDNFKFVKENMECTIYSYKGKVFNVEPPFFVGLRSPRPIPALPATPPRTPPSPPRWRPARRSRSRSLSSRARRSRSTPVRESISPEHKAGIDRHENDAAEEVC